MPEEPAGERIRAGQSPERVQFFTDAVFAIAMTLLVIEIPRAEGDRYHVSDHVSKSLAFERLWDFLSDNTAAFFSYLLAFFLLWIVWRQHHALFDQISRVTSRMTGWHFPLLLLAAFLPYATATVGLYPDNPMAALLFGVVALLLFVSRSMITTLAWREDDVLAAGVDRPQFRAEVAADWVVVAYWAATLSLVWLAPWIQLAWFGTSLVGSAASRLAREAVR